MQQLPTVSQGVPTTRTFFPAKSVAKAPSVNAIAPESTSSGGGVPLTGQTGGGAQSLPGQVDLQAFFAAWGTNSDQFDVTKDGTVDAFDLGVFLGGTPGAPSATNQADSPAQPPAVPTQQDVLNSWGQPNGAGDANGDGVVDGIDLAMALGNAQPNAAQSVAEGVQKTWGTDNFQYDINSDGTVDGADLALVLGGAPANVAKAAGEDETISIAAKEAAQKVTDAVFALRDDDQDGAVAVKDVPQASKLLSSVDADKDARITRDEMQQKLAVELDKVAKNPAGDMGDAITKWMAALADRSDARSVQARHAYVDTTKSKGVADRLYSQLSASGFSAAPPSNVSQLVSGMTGSRAERMDLLRGLSNRYPSGLGVSAQA
ncbi:MAG: dockerin type I domain-containing protein [Phycisphaerae bacterium]|nr:dockerin type I domain-containing protein [Phycisphaerae bacterium]